MVTISGGKKIENKNDSDIIRTLTKRERSKQYPMTKGVLLPHAGLNLRLIVTSFRKW